MAGMTKMSDPGFKVVGAVAMCDWEAKYDNVRVMLVGDLDWLEMFRGGRASDRIQAGSLWANSLLHEELPSGVGALVHYSRIAEGVVQAVYEVLVDLAYNTQPTPVRDHGMSLSVREDLIAMSDIGSADQGSYERAYWDADMDERIKLAERMIRERLELSGVEFAEDLKFAGFILT